MLAVFLKADRYNVLFVLKYNTAFVVLATAKKE